MKKSFLFTPGPVQVPEAVLLEMAQPILHHRTPQFSAIFRDTIEKLKWLYQTKSDVLILTSTGTGGMEGSVVNFLSRGDKAIWVNGGKFGERWGELLSAFGCEGIEVKSEWGQAVDPEAIRKALDEHPDAKAVYIQASETSTATMHPVKEIAALVKDRPGTLFVVDAITGLGAFDIPMDEWGIDVMISGSQKALMLPPGLAVVGVSEKAWGFAEKSDLPKYYLNFLKERKNHAKDTTSYTSAVTLVIGLNKALSLMQEDGLETIFNRTEKLAKATREALKAIGLKLLSENPAPSVTGAYVPEGIDGGKFTKLLRDTYGVALAGGQAHLKGKIFRISHMGYMTEWDTYTALTAVEKGLKEMGYDCEIGRAAGVAAKILGE